MLFLQLPSLVVVAVTAVYAAAVFRSSSCYCCLCSCRVSLWQLLLLFMQLPCFVVVAVTAVYAAAVFRSGSCYCCFCSCRVS